MGIGEKVDSSRAGQVFEVLLWLLNALGVVAIGLISWFMSQLFSQVQALDVRTRTVEINIATLVANRATLSKMDDRLEALAKATHQVNSEHPPQWFRDKVDAIDKRVRDLEEDQRHGGRLAK